MHHNSKLRKEQRVMTISINNCLSHLRHIDALQTERLTTHTRWPQKHRMKNKFDDRIPAELVNKLFIHWFHYPDFSSLKSHSAYLEREKLLFMIVNAFLPSLNYDVRWEKTSPNKRESLENFSLSPPPPSFLSKRK